jgi:hypothetical protein
MIWGLLSSAMLALGPLDFAPGLGLPPRSVHPRQLLPLLLLSRECIYHQEVLHDMHTLN